MADRGAPEPPLRLAWLVVTAGPAAGQQRRVDAPVVTVGGTDADLDLRDPALAPIEAAVERTDTAWWLVDRTGAGRPPVELVDGDELELGASRLAFKAI